MKIKHLATAGLLITAAALVAPVSANTRSGVLTRNTNASPAVATGCQVVTNSLGSVRFDSNLNTFGANVNIAPPVCPILPATSHLTSLKTTCFNGTIINQFGGGQAGQANTADLLHDCSAKGGGRRADWSASNN